MAGLVHRVGVAMAAVAVAVVGLAAPASADSAPSGSLLQHGAGSVFMGGNFSEASGVGAPGGTVSYTVKIKNTGSAASQFVLFMFPFFDNRYCDCNDATYKVIQGGLNGLLGKNVTAAATDAGYTTPTIQPGKELAFTLKVTIPKTGQPGGNYGSEVDLYSTASDYLDSVIEETEATATTGTSAIDQFVSTTGQSGVRGLLDYDINTVPAIVTVPLNQGASVKFTDKLVNDSTTAAAMKFSLPYLSFGFGGAVSCAPNYSVTVKAGNTDISAPALSTGYTTAVLAPTKALSLTITIKRVGNAPCNDPGTGGGAFLATTQDLGSLHDDVVVLSVPSSVS